MFIRVFILDFRNIAFYIDNHRVRTQMTQHFLKFIYIPIKSSRMLKFGTLTFKNLPRGNEDL